MFHKELLLGVQSSTLSWWTHSLTIGNLWTTHVCQVSFYGNARA